MPLDAAARVLEAPGAGYLAVTAGLDGGSADGGDEQEEFGAGCFAWSALRSAAACVVGNRSSLTGWTWTLTSLPSLDAAESLAGSDQELDVKDSVHHGAVLRGATLRAVNERMNQDRYEPLPRPRATFEPRQTLDLLVGGGDGGRGRWLRLRWSQMIESSVSIEQGSWRVYKDRIAVRCLPADAALPQGLLDKRESVQPTSAAPPLPAGVRAPELDLFLHSGPGYGSEARVIEPPGSQHLLVVIEKPYGIEGETGNTVAAALIRIGRSCSVERAE